MKITKSELKEMIRETLREELSKNKVLTEAHMVTLSCAVAEYEDDDGYVCKNLIYAGPKTEDELAEILYNGGMMYVDVYDKHDEQFPYTIIPAGKRGLLPGDVLRVLTVDDELKAAFSAVSGKDYDHVGFFEALESINDTEIVTLKCLGGEEIIVAKKDVALAKRLDRKASFVWRSAEKLGMDEGRICAKYGINDFSGVELFEKFADEAGLEFDIVV